MIHNRILMNGGLVFLTFALFTTPLLPALPITDATSKEFHYQVNEEQKYFPEHIQPFALWNRLFSSGKTSDFSLISLFTSTITTRYDDIEKTSEISFGLSNEIDIDNDNDTGVNGKDLRIQYILLPYLYADPDFRIGLIYSITLERIADELPDSPFSVSAELGDNIMNLGIGNSEMQGNDIPRKITFSSTLFLRFPDQTIGFSFSIDPEFDEIQENQVLELFAQFNDGAVDQEFSFTYESAISTEITISQTKKPQEWEYEFKRRLR